MLKPLTYSLAAIAALTGALALAPGTAFGAQVIQLLSGNGATTASYFDDASADGTRVLFETDENVPGTGDTDGQNDVYRATGGAITLLTGNGSSTSSAYFDAASADGTVLIFETDENIPGTGDTDGLNDIYRAQGGVITLLTGSNPAGSGGAGVVFSGASADGTRVFFETDEHIPGSTDVDGATDVYQASGGTISLLSGNGAATPAFFAGASADGTRVFFETTENISASGDTDGLKDVYQAQAGAITLLTGNNPAGSGGAAADFKGASADGTRVFFETNESISGTVDADGARDVYQATGGVVTLLSGNGDPKPAFFDRASTDGTRVFFETDENNVGGATDTDGVIDIYQATGGTISLLTGNGTTDTAFFSGASADGTRVFFSTLESIPGTGDSDGDYDVYQATGGVITLLTGNGAATSADFRGASADGSRVFFSTQENNVGGATDTDAGTDVYQARGGTISLLSGNGTADPADFDGASADGTRVFFETGENIAGTGDTDNAADIYLSRAAASASNPPPVTTPPTVAPTSVTPKKHCKKHRKLKHGKCVKKKHKK